MALVWIDPNYFGSLCSNPNKIQTNDMVGGVMYFCRQFNHMQTKIQKIINKVGHKRLEIRKWKIAPSRKKKSENEKYIDKIASKKPELLFRTTVACHLGNDWAAIDFFGVIHKSWSIRLLGMPDFTNLAVFWTMLKKTARLLKWGIPYLPPQ